MIFPLVLHPKERIYVAHWKGFFLALKLIFCQAISVGFCDEIGSLEALIVRGFFGQYGGVSFESNGILGVQKHQGLLFYVGATMVEGFSPRTLARRRSKRMTSACSCGCAAFSGTRTVPIELKVNSKVN